jgi:hypothetical protein
MAEFLLALSAFERWQAARRFDPVLGQRWFVLTGAGAVLALTAALIIVSRLNTARENQAAASAFVRLCERRGLSQRERQILMMMVAKTKLKRSESIFSLATAFDRGANLLIEEALVRWGEHQCKQQRIELSLLREKLGFRKKLASAAGSARKGAKPATDQIPVNKSIELTRMKGHSPGTLSGLVLENNHMELTVKLDRPVESITGSPWRGRYYFGPSVWEFDTFEISCKGRTLTLNHTDSVRFINRRSFPRVKVSRPAYVALFPFSRMVKTGARQPEEDSVDLQQQDSRRPPADRWQPPRFLAGEAVELAGPAMRIELRGESDIEVKLSDKLLVVVNLADHRDPGGIRIIEDICEVRQVQKIENGCSIAVELVGLGDSDVDELIRLTNAEARRNENNNRQNAPLESELVAAGAETVQKV